jgi:hypothetical protein
MKFLYKYPQRAFPYENLVSTNRQRGRNDLEYELIDTGIFDEDRYFDVVVEYAKSAPQDILIGRKSAELFAALTELRGVARRRSASPRRWRGGPWRCRSPPA